jgi:hypothetical protein
MFQERHPPQGTNSDDDRREIDERVIKPAAAGSASALRRLDRFAFRVEEELLVQLGEFELLVEEHLCIRKAFLHPNKFEIYCSIDYT